MTGTSFTYIPRDYNGSVKSFWLTLPLLKIHVGLALVFVNPAYFSNLKESNQGRNFNVAIHEFTHGCHSLSGPPTNIFLKNMVLAIHCLSTKKSYQEYYASWQITLRFETSWL